MNTKPCGRSPYSASLSNFADIGALVSSRANEGIYMHINNMSFIWLLQLANDLNKYANFKLWLIVYIGLKRIWATKNWKTPIFLPDKWVIELMYIINLILCFSTGETVNSTDFAAWRTALRALCSCKISQIITNKRTLKKEVCVLWHCLHLWVYSDWIRLLALSSYDSYQAEGWRLQWFLQDQDTKQANYTFSNC